jgi:hypothetical protein
VTPGAADALGLHRLCEHFSILLLIWVGRLIFTYKRIRVKEVTYLFVFVIGSMQMPKLRGFSEWRNIQGTIR